MSADSAPAATSVASASPAAPAAPLSERAAAAVLGSMLFLIVALTVLLVQSTLVEPASAAEGPMAAAASFTADGGSLAQR
ncbi:MAG: hypothetical protein ABJC36_10250 [Gemmatimonadales bacterium]